MPRPPSLLMQILFFGTFDERTHPRVQVLREGLAARGHSVSVCNAPLGVDTAARVELAGSPWRAIGFGLRVLRCWAVLLWRSRGLRPSVVVVGYLGQLDVHLARARFRRATIVLDQMVTLGDTVRDRGLDRRGLLVRTLDAIDVAAQRAADVVVVDTEEHALLVSPNQQRKAVVVPVGAPSAWACARSQHEPARNLRVVFFGLFTPLQGTSVIAEALRLQPDLDLECTLIGRGQELATVRSLLASDSRVTWHDWIDAGSLPRLVAAHDVCLGIFGSAPKALRVVPNKVFQGAAAGCAVVTSDTPPQRRALGPAARYVPPGDAMALAEVLAELATNPSELEALRAAAAERADTAFTPDAVIEPLVICLENLR